MKLNTFLLSTLSAAFILQGSSCFGIGEIEGEDQIKAVYPHYQAMVEKESAPVRNELTRAANSLVVPLNNEIDNYNDNLTLSESAELSQIGHAEDHFKNDPERCNGAVARLAARYAERRVPIYAKLSELTAQRQQVLINYRAQLEDIYLHTRKNVVAQLLAQPAPAAIVSEGSVQKVL